MKTGSIPTDHRQRSLVLALVLLATVAKAQLLLADGKFILLDEDGTLALARAPPQRFEVISRTALLKKLAWTPPTLVGTRLYVRDRETIMALELGPSAR